MFSGGDRVVPVLPKPMVCMPGSDRPVGVPRYVGKGECGTDEAREAMRLAFEKYRKVCGATEPRPGFQFWSVENSQTNVSLNEGDYRMRSVKCGSNGRKYEAHFHSTFSIPLVIKSFGLLDIEHPFFDVVYRLNFDQLHDFRSAESFIDAADKIEAPLKGAGVRGIEAVYLASGSHMTPLITALRLMDKDAIDRAHFTFTEIDEHAVSRVRHYLQAMTEGDGAVFEGPLSESTTKFMEDEQDAGYETTFSWKYRGKDVSVTMAIKRSDSYSRNEYLRFANLVIIHDLGTWEDEAGFEWVMRAASLKNGSETAAPLPAWALVERSSVGVFEPEAGEFEREGLHYSYETAAGSYGCGFNLNLHAVEGLPLWTANKRGSLEMVRPLRYERDHTMFGIMDRYRTRDKDDPFWSLAFTHYYPNPGERALLIKLPNAQEKSPKTASALTSQ